MHGHEDAIHSGEGEPEVQLAERLVETAPEHFWKPEKEGGKNRESGGDAHDQMKVAGDEVVVHGSASKVISREKESGDAARQKKRNETQGKEHRGIELDFGVPERAEPTEQKNAGRQAERGCQQRKNQWRPGIEAA